jgi:hypothetical protein
VAANERSPERTSFRPSRKRVLFDQRNHFGDFTEDIFCRVPAGDADVIIPDTFAIIDRLRRPKCRAPRSGHLPVLLADEILDAGLFSLSGVERANAFVDLCAQRAQLLDMREHRPPDLLLILSGEAFDFGYCFFQRFDHDASMPKPSMEGSSYPPP